MQQLPAPAQSAGCGHRFFWNMSEIQKMSESEGLRTWTIALCPSDRKKQHIRNEPSCAH